MDTPTSSSSIPASFFEQVLHVINTDIAVFDTDLRYEYVNPVAVKDPAMRAWMIGKTDEEYIRYRGRDPQLAVQRRRILHEALQTGRPVEFEEVLVTATGEERHFIRRACPVTSADGHVDGLIGYGFDVTDLRRADSAVRQSESSLRAFIDNAPYGIYRSTPDGRFTLVNTALVRMLGYSSEAELLLTDISRDVYVDGSVASRVSADQHNTLAVRLQWKRKDGQHITVRVTGRRLVDAAGAMQGWECFVEDVTRLDAAEEALRTSEEHLRHAQKMEAIGRMAGGIAHDFNNLLTAIKCNAELILDELPPAGPLRAEVEEINKATTRAAALTGQLLAFSRKQVLQPRVLNLNESVHDTEQMLRRLAGETIALRTVLSPSLGTVRADPDQLAQVLINLVVNARDAIADTGTITVTTRNVDPVDASVGQLGGVPEFGWVAVTVEDTGEGMDESVRERIFEPFYTTKPPGKGTGLGLSTAYGIVQQSGGHLTVHSAPGRGARFDVYLPRLSDGARPTSAPAQVSLALDGNETILLVEDQDTVRILAERILTQRGYRVLSARHASEAIATFQQYGADVDLLLTDVVMPGMSGRALAERLRQLSPTLRVLYMSGFHDDDALLRGLASDKTPTTTDFLQKPFSPQSLGASVREALDR